MSVVEVDQQKLSVALQFLFMFFCFGLETDKYTKFHHQVLKRYVLLSRISCNDVTYLFCHHLEEDIENLITNTNNALQHTCKDYNIGRES